MSQIGIKNKNVYFSDLLDKAAFYCGLSSLPDYSEVKLAHLSTCKRPFGINGMADQMMTVTVFNLGLIY